MSCFGFQPEISYVVYKYRGKMLQNEGEKFGRGENNDLFDVNPCEEVMDESSLTPPRALQSLSFAALGR